MCHVPVINLYKWYCFFFFVVVFAIYVKFSMFSYFHYTKTSEDAVAHDWILSFLFLFPGLTVQPTKSGKSAVWLLCTLVLYLLRCEHASCAGGEMQQQDWPCCHPTWPGPAHSACDTDLRLCPPTKVSEYALHLERPAVNTVASHGMPLFAFIGQHQHQTQTGLCELETIVELLVFSLASWWQVSSVDTQSGPRHCVLQGVKALLSQETLCQLWSKAVQGTGWKGEW